METEKTSNIKKPQRLKISKKRMLFFFITLVAIVFVSLQFDELREIKGVLLSSNLLWILIAGIVQSISYIFLSLTYKEVLKIKGIKIPLKELLPVSLVVQFFNQVLPSGNVSGQAFFIYYLRKYKLTVIEGVGRMLLELFTLYIAFAIYFTIAVVTLAARGSFSEHPEALIFVYVFLFIVALFSLILIQAQREKQTRAFKWLANRFHTYFEKFGMFDAKKVESVTGREGHIAVILGHLKETIKIKNLRKEGDAFWRAVLWQLLWLLVPVFTLYFIALSVGVKITFAIAFITFTLTKFVALLSFIPSAIGLFEFTMTAILIAFGVPGGAALAMTLLLRGFTFWLPMPFGWWPYKKYSDEIEEISTDTDK